MTPHRLADLSGALHDRAVDLARAGQHAAAAHAYHLSRVLFWRAGNKRADVRIDMINVRTYGAAKRRARHAVLA